MTLHTIIKYLKYRLKAKGRHGTHSPFVYALVEQLLANKPGTSLHQKINAYFTDYTVTYANDWATILPVENNRIIVVLDDIHRDKEHSKAWQVLCTDERVKMSIDMYTCGMLLFLDEFKEKQHFILKYSG